jgi:hypothetical protein
MTPYAQRVLSRILPEMLLRITIKNVEHRQMLKIMKPVQERMLLSLQEQSLARADDEL